MAIAKATIGTDVWDTIRALLNVAAITNNAKIVSAYAKSYKKNASNKDFVVIHKPSITNPRDNKETSFTGKKKYDVSIMIEVVCTEEEQMKVIADQVRNLLDSGITTTRGFYLFGFVMSGDEVVPETRDNRQILHNLLTAEYFWRGE
jgi:hypothetical protein